MKRITLVAALALSLAAGTAAALQYYPDKPLAFTWQNKHGGWFACGPTQCTLVSDKTEEKAFDYATAEWNGPWEFVGNHGRCKVYIGSGDIGGGQNSSTWLAERTREECFR